MSTDNKMAEVHAKLRELSRGYKIFLRTKSPPKAATEDCPLCLAGFIAALSSEPVAPRTIKIRVAKSRTANLGPLHLSYDPPRGTLTEGDE